MGKTAQSATLQPSRLIDPDVLLEQSELGPYSSVEFGLMLRSIGGGRMPLALEDLLRVFWGQYGENIPVELVRFAPALVQTQGPEEDQRRAALFQHWYAEEFVPFTLSRARSLDDLNGRPIKKIQSKVKARLLATPNIGPLSSSDSRLIWGLRGPITDAYGRYPVEGIAFEALDQIAQGATRLAALERSNDLQQDAEPLLIKLICDLSLKTRSSSEPNQV
jgi:hypothetical protein